MEINHLRGTRSKLHHYPWAEAFNAFPAFKGRMVGQGERPLACPYFIPSQPHSRELWPHRHRLPLGDGFEGRCLARPAEARCEDETLRLHCNLGYADLGYAEVGDAACVYLPADRALDAVRFKLRSESSAALRVQFACERAHRPALCGELRYDRAAGRWMEPPDPRLRALADAAVRAWLDRHGAA
jgi:hypothetical protein